MRQSLPCTFQTTLLLFLITNLTISTCSSKKTCCSFKDIVVDIHFNRVISMKKIYPFF